MRAHIARVISVNSLRASCIAILLGLGVSSPALAQTGSSTSTVPRNGFYVGLGASFNSVNTDIQHVFAVGTSDVFNSAGTKVQTGTADGPPAPVFMHTQSSFAPAAQGGYFQHFANTDWLWGAKASYSYLNTTSTTQNALIPQVGSFTTLSTGAVTPFTGNALISYAQTTVVQQMTLIPIFGHSFERSFVYVGVGPTLSQLRTNLNGLVGFADINGVHTDVSGPPQNFSGANWVYGFGGTVGATYFLSNSWFVDFTYTYAQTKDQTASFASTFANPNGANGTSLTGTLVGNSTWKAITQSFGVTINKLF